MIWYTIPQAAERVNRKPDTIRQWITNGLRSVRNPIDGQRYISEGDLIEVERAKRVTQQLTRRHSGADLREPVPFGS